MHADRGGQPPDAGGGASNERALQPDVGPDDASDSSVPAVWLTEYDGERAQNVDRLAADVELHLRLALLGFTGPEYKEFQEELIRYGLDVMTGFMRSRKIFIRMKEKGWGLPEVDYDLLDHEAQDELVWETVATALYHFHHDVLLKRKWNPSKGARLTTFFIGQCLMRFANIYRAWRNNELRSRDLMEPHDAEQWNDPGSRDVDDPQWLAVARGQIWRATRGIQDPRLRPVLERIVRGLTYKEIASELDLTEKTVERLVANHRNRIKTLGIA